MKGRTISIFLTFIFFSVIVEAAPCWTCALFHPLSCIGDSEPVWDYCAAYSTAGTCYAHGPKYWWVCSKCAPPYLAQCADYGIQHVCEQDPCGAGGMKDCNWTVTGTGGYCSAGCGGRSETSCRGDPGNQSGCLPEYDSSLNFRKCIDCPIGHECSDYVHGTDCGINTCKVAGSCIWWGDTCVGDADGDGCPDDEDNCPGIANMDPSSRDMNNTFCDVAGSCDREGDACDDTDGDGLTDQFEKERIADGQDPVNTDANENCIPDGVEYGFGPLIGMLRKIAVAVGTLMLAYLGVGWLTADTPAKRDNSKRGAMYIIAGLILLVAANNMVIFLLQGSCTRPPDVGAACSSCTKTCPTAPTTGGSSPFIYSFNGSSFILEHDAFPFAVLPAWEYETYSRLEHVRPVSGFYHIRIAEELAYTTYANRIRFLVVDHPGDVSVLPDLYGGVHTIAAALKPLSCVEEDGSDCMSFMGDDGVYWMSSTDDKHLLDSDGDGVVDEYSDEDLFDGIILSFPNPGKAVKAKLVLKVRESGGIDLAWHKLLDLLGKDDAEKLMRLSGDDRLRGLVASLVNREALYHVRVREGGKWILAESFGVGPNIPYEFVIPIDVPGEDNVLIKLDSAVIAYETDYASLDYSENEKIKVTGLSPERVELANHRIDDESLKMILLEDDDEYLPLDTGDYVNVYFKVPEAESYGRTVIVGVKGYYITHVSGRGDKSLDSLEKMGRFILEPTYAIRYTYPKYLRSHWNEKNA